MNKEVKEIIDKLKDIHNFDYSKTCDCYNNVIKKEYDIYLSKKETDKLLDYITSLEKENKILRENAIHNDKVVDKAKWNEMLYKSRIDKALKFMDDNVIFEHDGDDYGYTEYINFKIPLQEFIETEQDILKGSDK